MSIILLIFIFAACLYCLYNSYCNENFNLTTGKWCINCEKKTFGECMDCFNCGFCATGPNQGYCTKGNLFGPDKYTEKCQKWIHNDEFSRELNRTNKMRSI